MSVDVTNEKRFEDDITASFLSPAGGYTHNDDVYDPALGLFSDTLMRLQDETMQLLSMRHILLRRVVLL